MRKGLDNVRRRAASLRLRRTSTLGVAVDSTETLQGVVDLFRSHLVRRASLLVTFVNPSSRNFVQTTPGFLQQLEAFDAVLPDGVGMSIAIRVLHRLPATRVSFDMTSLAPEVLGFAERYGRSVVLVGGVAGCAKRAGHQLQALFPNLRVIGAFDGFGDLSTRADEIVALDPDIVVAGMGAGAQEAMLLALKAAGWTGCGFTCGGFFDQLANGAEYYPPWINRLQLRWAYRLSKEPRRLWRRYLLTYPPFFVALAIEAAMKPARSWKQWTRQNAGTRQAIGDAAKASASAPAGGGD